jgi:hypothetical protein
MKPWMWMVAGVCMLCASVSHAVDSRNDYPIQPAPFTAVHVDDGFWSPVWINRTVTWRTIFRMRETGRIDNSTKRAD